MTFFVATKLHNHSKGNFIHITVLATIFTVQSETFDYISYV